MELESAGTGAWHVGSAPDERARAAALARGVELEGRARQVRWEDFEDFDLVLAMDGENMRELRQLAPGEEERAKVRLLREFDPASASAEEPGRARPVLRRGRADSTRCSSWCGRRARACWSS